MKNFRLRLKQLICWNNVSNTTKQTSPTAVQQTSPIQPDEQAPRVTHKISPVQPASPVPPSEQLPKILQEATPVPVKSSHLEEIITNIKKKKSDYYFEKQFTQNQVVKVKRDPKSENTTEAMEYIKDCFGEKLDNMDFLSWISDRLGYKPLLEVKASNKQRSSHSTTYQDIYNFWLSTSINSNNSRCNVISISKRTFLQQYRFSTY